MECPHNKLIKTSETLGRAEHWIKGIFLKWFGKYVEWEVTVEKVSHCIREAHILKDVITVRVLVVKEEEEIASKKVDKI